MERREISSVFCDVPIGWPETWSEQSQQEDGSDQEHWEEVSQVTHPRSPMFSPLFLRQALIQLQGVVVWLRDWGDWVYRRLSWSQQSGGHHHSKEDDDQCHSLQNLSQFFGDIIPGATTWHYYRHWAPLLRTLWSSHQTTVNIIRKSRHNTISTPCMCVWDGTNPTDPPCCPSHYPHHWNKKTDTCQFKEGFILAHVSSILWPVSRQYWHKEQSVPEKKLASW